MCNEIIFNQTIFGSILLIYDEESLFLFKPSFSTSIVTILDSSSYFQSKRQTNQEKFTCSLMDGTDNESIVQLSLFVVISTK